MSAFILAILLSAGVPQTATQPRDAEAIAAAKRASVNRIDPSLPDKPLEKWLREVVGRQPRITWEVNDCGEQTGNPELDKGRDFPMCVEAQVRVKQKTTLHVSVSVGTFKTGVRPGAVRFAYAVIEQPGGRSKSVRKLSQVPKAIKASP
jgi:hypothetical protein